MKNIVKEKNMVVGKCPYCSKRIEAENGKHLKYLILQHKISKHKDKIKIEELA